MKVRSPEKSESGQDTANKSPVEALRRRKRAEGVQQSSTVEVRLDRAVKFSVTFPSSHCTTSIKLAQSPLISRSDSSSSLSLPLLTRLFASSRLVYHPFVQTGSTPICPASTLVILALPPHHATRSTSTRFSTRREAAYARSRRRVPSTPTSR